MKTSQFNQEIKGFVEQAKSSAMYDGLNSAFNELSFKVWNAAIEHIINSCVDDGLSASELIRFLREEQVQ